MVYKKSRRGKWCCSWCNFKDEKLAKVVDHENGEHGGKKGYAIRSKLLAIVIFVLGFLLTVLGLAWAITLSQRQLAENSGLVAILIDVGIILMVIGWKE